MISKNGAPPIPELPETQQANYINITPQPGLHRKSSDPAPLQNYEKLRFGKGISPPLSSSAMANSSPLATSPPLLIPRRDPMGTYADLVFPLNEHPQNSRPNYDFVQYSFMNFEVMEAIRKTKEEREEEIRLRMEEEARAEELRKEEEKLAKKKAKIVTA